MTGARSPSVPMRLVERYRGRGDAAWGERVYRGVAYRIDRFQGMSASGLPVPGLHRIDGSIDVAEIPEICELVDREFTMLLEDGRSLRLRLTAADGRVLAEGHGPSRCQCC